MGLHILLHTFQDLFDAVGGTAGLDFTYDGDDATITVGGTSEPIKDLRDKNPQDVLKEVEKAVNKERKRLSQGGAEGDNIFI